MDAGALPSSRGRELRSHFRFYVDLLLSPPEADRPVGGPGDVQLCRRSAGRHRARAVPRRRQNGEMKIGGHTSRLGVATSSDGLHFTRRPEPVLYPKPDAKQKHEWPGGVEDPRLVARRGRSARPPDERRNCGAVQCWQQRREWRPSPAGPDLFGWSGLLRCRQPDETARSFHDSLRQTRAALRTNRAVRTGHDISGGPRVLSEPLVSLLRGCRLASRRGNLPTDLRSVADAGRPHARGPSLPHFRSLTLPCSLSPRSLLSRMKVRSASHYFSAPRPFPLPATPVPPYDAV